MTTIEDIYCELPFDIEVFLNMVLEGKTYPINGTMAEKMKLFFDLSGLAAVEFWRFIQCPA